MKVWGAAPPSAPNPVPAAQPTSPVDFAAFGAYAPPAQPPQSSSPRPWLRWGLIAAGVVLAFVLAGGATYLIMTRSVPDVQGLSLATAEATLEEAGFTATSTSQEFSETVPRGFVSEQSPTAGSRTRSGEAVTLTVSRGEAKVVPILSGKSLVFASQQLNELNLELTSSTEPSETVPEGAVVSQSPAAGTLLEEGDRVSIVVSSGPPYTTVSVTLDLSSVVLDTSASTCSDTVTYLQILFSNAEIQNGQGQTLSTMGGLWQADANNGYFFPCEATAEFPRTSTAESSYIFDLDPSSAGNSGIWTRSEMERNNWRINLG